jgi:monoamine oxidase
MCREIKTKPTFYRRVVAIKEVPDDDYQSLSLTIDARGDPNLSKNGLTTPKYSNVICTVPLSVLRTVDLDNCQLLAGQKNALRELQYSPSIKVGIQFKTAWWEELGIIGGQSYTDRPVRAVVYPSHGPGEKKTNVLIASYNGMQDSQRLGALMRGRGTSEEQILLNLVMNDLAVIHNKHVDEIWAEYVDYYPWDWYSNGLSLGNTR